MKIILILIISIILFSGCDDNGARVQTLKGGVGLATICIDSISYIKYFGYSGNSGYFGLTIKLNKDSKVIPCTY